MPDLDQPAIAPGSEPDYAPSRPGGWKDYYAGEMSLPVTFWGSIAIVHIGYWRGVSELIAQGWRHYPSVATVSLTFIYLVFGIFLWAVSSIAIWRSASRYTGSRTWAAAAKIWVVVNILLNLWTFAARFLPSA